MAVFVSKKQREEIKLKEEAESSAKQTLTQLEIEERRKTLFA